MTNPITIDTLAPDFLLKNQHGQAVSLSQYQKGSEESRQAVVVFFYPKDHTPACTQEVCNFRDHYEAFKEAGAEVIGISSDAAQSHQAFAEQHQLPFQLLSDKGGAVRKAWGVPKTLGLLAGRVTYVVDKQGIVRHIFSSQLNIKRHIQDALSILKALK